MSLLRMSNRPAVVGRRPMPVATRRIARPSMPARFVGLRAIAAPSRPKATQPIPYKELCIGVPAESFKNEKRVAIVPATVQQLVKAGFKAVYVEKGAGAGSGFTDEDYRSAGATVVDSNEAYKQDVVIKVRPPSMEEVGKLTPGVRLVSHIQPAQNKALVEALQAKQATVLALDCIPRTLSRAQAFDTLSSMANIAGYRAVVEASHNFGRFFTGQITAAGRVPPAKVLVIGGGVAGLAACGAAKSLGAIVRVFDTRAAVKEQAASMGAEFLTVDIKEDGESATGYSKEMSPAFIAAEMKLFSDQCKEIDIVITTALIPGKPAPKLITKEMVKSMKQGSVIIDLSAEAGGNCEMTKPGERIVTDNGVIIIGYTDMASRLATQASTLWSNNVAKFLTSVGPFTNPKAADEMVIDHKDEAVRGALVLEDGTLTWPPPPPAARAAPPAPPKPVTAAKKDEPKDLYPVTLKSALVTTGAAAGMMAVGAVSPSTAFSAMLTKFGLASICGYQTVWGVVPALHSPLMSVTNAVSGLTAVGGLVLLGGSLLPSTTAQGLAALAVLVSAINIGGGFTITQRMLDMFKRPTDPEEHLGLYAIPGALVLGGYLVGNALGLEETITPATYLVSSALCIAAIACLSKQSSARTGNALGMIGVSGGITAALGSMHVGLPVYAQAASLLGAGAFLGNTVASRIKITELPQMVAAFHSLVGLAATVTAIATVLEASDVSENLDTVHKVTVFLGDLIGAITLTGSAIAFGKLQGVLDSKALNLPGKNAINIGLLTAALAAGYAFLNAGDVSTATGALTAVALLSGVLGAHLTASIGGAVMPVVITLLNSYSGYALCAEGFMLNNDELTAVGALIGSSGAILSYIMCVAMNRSLPNVIFGGYGTPAPSANAVAAPHGEHKEIDITGAANELIKAKRVVIVPGYGLAVANAQHVFAELTTLLTQAGVEVKFAIHPVAGRMPGQLNVLLAEAGVSYELVEEMDEANPHIGEVDVSVIVGANDTVNSAALEDPNSVIAGMPVIEVWKSKHVIFMKRSMATGYAGADNPVFYKENTSMLLGDAKVMGIKLKEKVSELLGK